MLLKAETSLLILLICLNMSFSISRASLVICGPSGVGKSTLVGAVCKRFQNKVALCVSHTSRKPRPGEVDGVHYHFSSEKEMKKQIDKNLFLEHAYVHTNIYGTSRAAVERILATDKLPILDVDTRGVQSIKAASGFDAKYVFIAPPSLDSLYRRLSLRGTETDADMQVRLTNVQKELE